MELEDQILAEMEATAFAMEQGYISLILSENFRLTEAIDRCLELEDRIDEIVAAIPPAEDPDNEIEVDAIAWKKYAVRKQCERAVRAGKERKAHLDSLQTDLDWEQERERIRDGEAGMKHWFRFWAWALDPRADFLPVQPFVPFGVYEDDESDFQWRYILWLEHTTFVKRKSGLVKKARDMGATLGWLLWSTYNWLTKYDFTALLASANEDLVDSKKDPDTLFEKVRFALKLQPPQLLPTGFNIDKDMPYMNIANPENGSVLSGQAPTANAGRQKRRKAVLKDESAAWPYGGVPQATALSAVSDCCFDVSSVQGKYNNFHVEATRPRVNMFVMDWHEHPWKDERWYKALPHGYVTQAMTAQTIAQEVDMDFDASQPGKVFTEWEETRTCIEWPELLAFYTAMGFGDRFKYADGTDKIPDDWNFARMQDKGETKDHPRMTLYCAVPGQGWPLSDSIFFFIEHMAPTAADLQTVVNQLTRLQDEFHIGPPRKPNLSLISHEAKKDRDIYQTLKWEWNTWDTDYDAGIGNIRLWIKPVDTHLPNPIRPMLNGRSKIYLVCQKGQATLFYNEKERKYEVSPAKNERGFIRLRQEFPVYHYPAEEAGKPVKDQRPERIFDDALVCVRGVAVLWGPKPKKKTAEEKMHERLAPELRPGQSPYEIGSPEHDSVLMSRKIWTDEFKEERRSGLRGVGPIRVLRKPPNRG